jgi:hypothetical protein
MLAYKINPDGYGFSADLPDKNKFFWSRLTAGKFCEAELFARVLTSYDMYIESNYKALALRPAYVSTRRDIAFHILREFNASQHASSLLSLAVAILELEPELRTIMPGKTHPYHFYAKAQFNDLIWLCIRIRKQFKIQT